MHIDRLELDLHGPMLDEFMKSQQLKAELYAIGKMIERGYRSRVPVDSGDLKSATRVTMHKSTVFTDRRWEAEFSVGNSRVDYAAFVEDRDHPLGYTLVSMGYRNVWNIR